MTGTRRGNRESTILEKPNARGYFEAKVWMGVKPDGRPDRRRVERRTRAAARKRVRELERQRDAGLVLGTGRAPMVEQMLTRHLDVVLVHRGRAPRTILEYGSKCRNGIFPPSEGSGLTGCSPSTLGSGLCRVPLWSGLVVGGS
jgi:integrase